MATVVRMHSSTSSPVDVIALTGKQFSLGLAGAIVSGTVLLRELFCALEDRSKSENALGGLRSHWKRISLCTIALFGTLIMERRMGGGTRSGTSAATTTTGSSSSTPMFPPTDVEWSVQGEVVSWY